MYAGVCGKRRGSQEPFGSSPSSAKRSKFSSFGSPESELTRPDEQISFLLGMFPCLDPQLVENVLRSQDNKIEDSVESLHALSYVDAITRNEAHSYLSTVTGNCSALQGGSTVTFTDISKNNENFRDSRFDFGMEGSGWVELLVEEMMNSIDVDDAKSRATRTLVAFEHTIASEPRETEEVDQQEHASLKEHLQNLYNDNQILKRAVAIQAERHTEQEHKAKEAQHLKQMLSQYEEKARNLELSNYALTIHLQRAQESNSGFGQFHPDIY